jgi:hypothetical protein
MPDKRQGKPLGRIFHHFAGGSLRCSLVQRLGRARKPYISKFINLEDQCEPPIGAERRFWRSRQTLCRAYEKVKPNQSPTSFDLPLRYRPSSNNALAVILRQLIVSNAALLQKHARNIVATDIIMRVGVSRMGQTRRCENGGVLYL